MYLQLLVRKCQELRNRHFIVMDLLCCLVSPLLALFFRLDGSIDFLFYAKSLAGTTLIFTFIKMAIFIRRGLYKRYWCKASVDDMAKLFLVAVYSIVVQSVAFTLLRDVSFLKLNMLPRFFPLYDGMIMSIFLILSRSSIRVSNRLYERRTFKNQSREADNTLICGAGEAGVTIIEELQRNPQLGIHPVAFVDDDPSKHGLRIRGIEVKGDRKMLPALIKRYNARKVLIAMPTAPGLVIREITEMCNAEKVEAFTMPGLFEIVDGKVTVNHIKKVEVEDLLRREAIHTDFTRVSSYLKGKRVLITGAGGSIGSELARQVLSCRPAELLLLGHGENSIFEIEQELMTRIKNSRIPIETKLSCKIADLRFRERIDFIFDKFTPDVVYHAAAHKHVPLMEENPPEAITNNVLGTKNLVEAAVEVGVEHFILVSTDKAVNPANIMGASKRIAEMIVHNAALRTGYCYSAVRFGNVLGSRGSVIRTFKKQIDQGGPLTITHPDITRYFITIPEAVQLVLQASVMSSGGEIFVLDMGKPVKIYDLAKDMIALSGLELGRDIDITVTGLRPGEKLYEELFKDGEDYQRTANEKIFIAANASRLIVKDLTVRVNELIDAAMKNDYKQIMTMLMDIIVEYTPDSRHVKRLQITPEGKLT